MNKFKFLTVILFALYSCSYQPILKNKEYNFQFVDIKFDENTKINKIIANHLSRKSSGTNEYNIFYETSKNKNIIATDKKGDPTVYSLTIDINYKITKNESNIINNRLSKQTTYNNIDDKFELSKKEDDIIAFLAEDISDEILKSTLSIIE